MFLSEHLRRVRREDGLFTFPEEGMHKLSLGEWVGLCQKKDGKLFQNVEIVYAKARDMNGHDEFWGLQ